jgi:hypothetical protein
VGFLRRSFKLCDFLIELKQKNVMQKYFPKNAKKFQQEKRTFKSPQDKSIYRFSGNASRLEHSNVRNKNKGKKG